jgi:hypothetical protein
MGTGRTHWPRGVRRGSAAARLLGLRIRIPPRAGISVSLSVVCCQVEVPASGWSLVQTSPTQCGVSECDRDASIMRRPWPTGGCCAMGKYEDSTIFLANKYACCCLSRVLFDFINCVSLSQNASVYTVVEPIQKRRITLLCMVLSVHS